MYLCQLANKDGNQRSDVSKTGQFTHVSSIFRHVVRGKRFITHGSLQIHRKLNKISCPQQFYRKHLLTWRTDIVLIDA